MCLDLSSEAKPKDAATFLSDASLQKEVKKLKEADKDGTQTIIVSKSGLTKNVIEQLKLF